MALFSLSISISILVLFSKTPLMTAMLIVTQTIVVAVSTYLVLATSWLSFILFMILVSAMMVIFVYVSSLASNELFAMSFTTAASAIYFTFVSMLLAQLLFTRNQSYYSSQPVMSDSDLGPTTFYKLYATHASSITMFLIIYLLVALIVVAKISMSLKGALRALKL